MSIFFRHSAQLFGRRPCSFCPVIPISLSILKAEVLIRTWAIWPLPGPNRMICDFESRFPVADHRGSPECQGLARVSSSRSNRPSECHPVAVTPIVARLRRCASEHPQPNTFVIEAKQFRKAPDR
jgi:hypothetical protein